MLTLEFAEIYITNACNLNCPDCITFNNLNFKGHQRWKDYRDIYQTWSQRLHIKRIGLIGGEPLLNPDFLDWLDGTLELWPNSKIEVTSNGTQLSRWPQAYKRLSDHRDRLTLNISAHGPIQRNKICQYLQQWMEGPVQQVYLPDAQEIGSWIQNYNNIKDPSWPDLQHPHDWINLPRAIKQECTELFKFDLESWYNNLYHLQMRDASGVTIDVKLKNHFTPNALILDPDMGVLRLRQNQIQKSYDVCCARGVQAGHPEIFLHHFNKGLLYKCSTVALLPEIVQQFNVELSEIEKKLLDSYVACNPTATDEILKEFVDDLKQDKAITQCRFCQDHQTLGAPFEAGTKKITWYKKIKNVSD